MICLSIAVGLLLLWNGAITYRLYQMAKVQSTMLKGQNSLAVTMFRLIMILTDQPLDEPKDDDEVPPSVDDLLKDRE